MPYAQASITALVLPIEDVMKGFYTSREGSTNSPAASYGAGAAAAPTAAAATTNAVIEALSRIDGFSGFHTPSLFPLGLDLAIFRERDYKVPLQLHLLRQQAQSHEQQQQQA